MSQKTIQAAELLMPCQSLSDNLNFFSQQLNFRVDAIFPADNSHTATISGHGLRIRLQEGREDKPLPITLRLLCDAPEEIAGGELLLTAPNGVQIELVAADKTIEVPPIQQSYLLNRQSGDAPWIVGRAGMEYRDLIPGRQGGRFIASHIRINDAGPVADYVHYHKVRFQLIYCYKGWVRVAYEDQGDSLLMEAGDCFLQPPQIRHRVLECSAGMEVIEVGCPAEHETIADHSMSLSGAEVVADRVYGGQHFVFHRVAEATWQPWRLRGFECRDIGIDEATQGLVSAQVVRCAENFAEEDPEVGAHDEEFLLFVVLSGSLTLLCESQGGQKMVPGDACVIPHRLSYALSSCSEDLELLEVRMSAVFSKACTPLAYSTLLENL